MRSAIVREMMDLMRMARPAGVLLVAVGVTMAVASLTSIGEAQSWNVANAFAADSVRPIRRVGMLLAIVSLAILVATTPILLALLRGTPGRVWVLAGWVGFALGATLFAVALGVTAIVMPALGELARSGTVSPQEVADHMIRQAPLTVAFVGGNLMFLSWVPIGLAISRSGVFPGWLGWLVAASAVAGWLSFLHVPGVRLAGPLWPLALALVGVFIVAGG